MIFFVQCMVDADKRHLRAELLDAHRANVGRNREVLVYGGVVEGEAAALERVVYFLDAPSEAAARAFVEADGYRAMYRHVEIVGFQQRVPRPAAGMADHQGGGQSDR